MRAHKSQFNEKTIEEIINAFKQDNKNLEKFNASSCFGNKMILT